MKNEKREERKDIPLFYEPFPGISVHGFTSLTHDHHIYIYFYRRSCCCFILKQRLEKGILVYSVMKLIILKSV